MDDKRKLTGHPWHVEYLKMDEDDTRRHKSRCIYHLKNNYCRKTSGNCFGSSHCSFYKESATKQLNQNQNRQQPEQINRQQSKQLSRQQINELLQKIFGE